VVADSQRKVSVVVAECPRLGSAAAGISPARDSLLSSAQSRAVRT
jgi:hypothetical protein